jgi:hypothetical protein
MDEPAATHAPGRNRGIFDGNMLLADNDGLANAKLRFTNARPP